MLSSPPGCHQAAATVSLFARSIIDRERRSLRHDQDDLEIPKIARQKTSPQPKIVEIFPRWTDAERKLEAGENGSGPQESALWAMPRKNA
jgi:hypothetical protein